MSSKEPWLLLLEKLEAKDSSFQDQINAVSTLLIGIKANEIATLKRYSDVSVRDTNLTVLVGRLSSILRTSDGDPKIKGQVALGLGDIGKIILNDLTKIKPRETPLLLSIVQMIKDGLMDALQPGNDAAVRRAAQKALDRLAGKPWWKFW